MEQNFPKPRVNPEYRRMYQPITKEEYEALEQELLSRKDTVTIKTWSTNILYDFEKFEICQKHHIPYRVSLLYARNTIEALLWLCKNQLERKDLIPEMNRYLIGKRYLFERILGSHDVAAFRASNSARDRPKKTEPKYDDCAGKTRERLGKEYNLVPVTIWKYSLFAEAVDTIYEISEDLAQNILNGSIKISQENLISISKMSEEEIRNMAEYILREKADFSTYTGSRKFMEKIKPEAEKEAVTEKTMSIKDMPAYDPDAEAASLILTIPSWISSIQRAINASDMNKVSIKAKGRLKDELEKLWDVIFETLDVLKEE